MPGAGLHAGTGGRVYFSVFAGRKRFLSILLVYVRQLLEDGTVDEAHLWDYTRSVPADKELLAQLRAEGNPRLQVITPPESDAHARFPHKWKGYYAHYAKELADSDWLVKCDDDVVFIANLASLLRFARADGGAHQMYYPSVVNNDVSASFQAADGVIRDPEYALSMRASRPEGPFSRAPISDWYNCTHCAEHVHSLFLQRPEAFFTGCAHEWRVAARVPINFFVMAGRHVRETFGAYTQEAFVDEAYLTALATQRSKRASVIVTDAVVVHFSFAFQHMERQAEMLDAYRKLAKNTALHANLKTKFGNREPSRACAESAPAALLLGRRLPRPRAGQNANRGNRSRFGQRHAGLGTFAKP